MRKVIADHRISSECTESLIRLGFAPILLPPFRALPSPVASHPDMLIFLFDDKLICHKDYYKVAKKELDSLQKEIILSDEDIGNVYPHDILFNAATIGTNLIGKIEHISSHIKNLPYNKINTNQGYAKCSCCTVDDNAVITSDRSIEKALKTAGIDVLRITPGYVDLPGYDTGFIGGASGMTDSFVAFCGNIDTHPDAKKIKDFCKKYKKETISLSNEPLFDAGTLFFI